jgi:hypothetical protein
MIKGIVNGPGVVIHGGWPSYPSFSMNPNNPIIGAMRFNSISQNVEVFDGSGWLLLNGSIPMVGLAPDSEKAIEWAKKKMEEEAYVLGLSREYPVIKDLLDQQNNIKHKIDMVVALVKTEAKV